MYLGLWQISEMTTFMGVVEYISPTMRGRHWWIIHTQVHWWISYIRVEHYVCRTAFQISGNASDIQNLFMCLGLAVLKKHLTDDHCWMFLRDGFVIRVWHGPWLPAWIDIPIWYHYIVICTLVTIFNWCLSSKDMELQVLIKEVLDTRFALYCSVHLRASIKHCF